MKKILTVVFVASWIEDMCRKIYQFYLWQAKSWIYGEIIIGCNCGKLDSECCGENLIGCICGRLDSGYVEKILSVLFLASWIVDMWRKSYRLYFWPAG